MLHLPTHLGLLKIHGQDAKKILQGQLTCDLELVTSEKINLGAHCNHQGRVISFFYIFLYENAYFLVMQKNMLAIALAALKKYAVFFKVEISEVIIDDPVINFTEKLLTKEFPTMQSNEWEYRHIQEKIPIIYPETSGKFLPQEINLDKLNAISFNKGCYTGQEIIARIHYKAKLKNKMVKASTHDNANIMPAADIYFHQENQDKVCGSVVNACEYENHYYLLIVINELHDHLFVNKSAFLTIEK